MTNKEKLIYFAGIIDGEGCFSYQKEKKKDRPRAYYYPRLDVIQKKLPLLNWIKKNYGGCIYGRTQTNPNDRSKTCFGHVWTLKGKKVTELAKKMLPYFIVKKEQVKRVL